MALALALQRFEFRMVPGFDPGMTTGQRHCRSCQSYASPRTQHHSESVPGHVAGPPNLHCVSCKLTSTVYTSKLNMR